MKYIVEFWSSFLDKWCYYRTAESHHHAFQIADFFEVMYGEETRVRII